MRTRSVYLAFGSNLGDREKNIRDAVAMLDSSFGVSCKRLSRLIETKAEGFDGPAFLNAAAMWELNLEPLSILQICKETERRLGRTDEGIRLDSAGRRIYKNRLIDIDILLIGDEKVDTPVLQVPHPRMKEREFVLLPLKEILTDFE
ncbi:MAG: 2-amino-4-hydroxy-6-hydroxymethyldihydropteridine diphosphokinase [Candidatus Cryptobacteroides sp.]